MNGTTNSLSAKLEKKWNVPVGQSSQVEVNTCLKRSDS